MNNGGLGHKAWLVILTEGTPAITTESYQDSGIYVFYMPVTALWSAGGLAQRNEEIPRTAPNNSSFLLFLFLF